MSDLGTMISRIADELARGDLTTTQIPRAIQSAIAHYERERWWFQESVFSFQTVPDRDTYSASDASQIACAKEIDQLRLAYNATTRYVLKPRTFEYLNRMSVNPSITGAPDEFAYRGKHIRVYPIADATYSVAATAVLKLPALSANSDTNAWMTEAEELIRVRAKMDLYATVVRDQDMAASMRVALREDIYPALRAEHVRRTMLDGTLQPSGW